MSAKSHTQATKPAVAPPVARRTTPQAASPMAGPLDAQQAMHDPSTLSPQAVLRLQRSMGNRAVANLLQRKVDEAARVRQADKRTDEQVTAEADAALAPDYLNPAIRDRRPTKYVFTIAVWRENAGLLDFVKLRSRSIFRNKLRQKFSWMPGVRKAKTNEEIKLSTAKRLAKSAPAAAQMSPAQLADAARSIVRSSGAVGHTWLKLKTFVGDRLQKLYTFGLHPISPGRPNQDVPGRIAHPDNRNESSPGTRFIDTQITSTDFESAMEYIRRLIKGRTAYNLLKKNCTTFVRDVAAHLGISFPGGATVIPYGPLKMFSETMVNPNQLYEDMSKDPDAHDRQAAPPRDEQPPAPTSH